MLDINMEFRKGILFVRLKGVLNKITVDKLNEEVTELVKDNGVRNLVFNMENVISIDMKGINALLYNYELCHDNQGKTMICNIENNIVKTRLKKSHILKYMYEASDELTAMNHFYL